MRERRKAETVLPPPMQLMLSDKEVAAMLGIGVSTVWKKTNDPEGNFPPSLQHHRTRPSLAEVRHHRLGQRTQLRQS